MKTISDIGEVHDILLGILSYIKDICEKNGIKYYLANGTLLGACKYQDFIAWDDDADIVMPREDYDRFLQLCSNDIGRYQLLSPLDKDYRYTYSKMIDSYTILDEKNIDVGLQMGVFVDIFPLDKWNPNPKKARIQSMYCDVLKRQLIYAASSCFATERQGLQRLLLYFMYKLGQAKGCKKLQYKITNQAKRFNNTDSTNCGCVVWSAHGSGEVMPTEIFSNQSTASIRGVEFAIPSGYDTYLSYLYGAWKDELPKAMQKSNHNFAIWWK